MSSVYGNSLPKIIQIENYINSVKTMDAKFIQISDTGKVETGSIFFQKPDKLRFEYDKPSQHLILINGPALVLFDRKNSKIPQKYLTSQTPLSFLLKDPIQLRNNKFLNAMEATDNLIHLKLSNKEKPKLGKIELLFKSDPIEFNEWVIVNFSGEKTRLLFEDIKVNKPVNKKLFNIQAEIEKLANSAN